MLCRQDMAHRWPHQCPQDPGELLSCFDQHHLRFPLSVLVKCLWCGKRMENKSDRYWCVPYCPVGRHPSMCIYVHCDESNIKNGHRFALGRRMILSVASKWMEISSWLNIFNCFLWPCMCDTEQLSQTFRAGLPVTTWGGRLNVFGPRWLESRDEKPKVALGRSKHIFRTNSTWPLLASCHFLPTYTSTFPPCLRYMTFVARLQLNFSAGIEGNPHSHCILDTFGFIITLWVLRFDLVGSPVWISRT